MKFIYEMFLCILITTYFLKQSHLNPVKSICNKIPKRAENKIKLDENNLLQ